MQDLRMPSAGSDRTLHWMEKAGGTSIIVP